MVSTLFVPYRDGLVKLDSAGANPRDGWITAEPARVPSACSKTGSSG
jgi:hypothetical protein